MNAPKEVSELVERFGRSRDAYLSGEYNEAQLRSEFLDPFFSALGWDVKASRDMLSIQGHQRQIDATDKHIDELVYELYGLTEEERRIVENA